MFGYEWKIIRKKSQDCWSGNYYWQNHTIVLGTKNGGIQWEVLFHEITEAILTNLHYRFYGQESSTEYQFIFNHTDLCRFVKELHQIFKDNKLI